MSKIISLDIETYGCSKQTHDGRALPNQSVYHPQRMIHTDGVAADDIILTAAITIPKHIPYWMQQLYQETKHLYGIPIQYVSKLDAPEWEVGDTMTFRFHKPEEMAILVKWVENAEVIIGQNIQFDILCLRNHPLYGRLLDRNKILLDLSILNFLHSELRPEKSLKDIGLILGTHRYERTLKTGKFESPDDPELHKYNAADTHNTLLDCFVIGDDIQKSFPDTDKLSKYGLTYFSDLLWSCIRMAEAGIPVSTKKLKTLETSLVNKQEQCADFCRENQDLFLGGKGSQKTQNDFIRKVITAIDEQNGVSIEQKNLSDSVIHSDQIQKTDITKKISWNKLNREFFSAELAKSPSGGATSLIKTMDYADEFVSARRTITQDTAPLLRCRPRGKRDAILINDIAYPNWHPVPSRFHDEEVKEHGQKQGRCGCQGPEALKWDNAVTKCITSRFSEGYIVSGDMSQHEMRVAGLLSGEPALLASFLEGIDLHSDRAIDTFGRKKLISICGEDLTKDNALFKPYRDGGKTVNFSDLFLSGAEAIQTAFRKKCKLYVDFNICSEIVRNRRILRPQLTAWQDALVAETRSKGYICLPYTGHSRFFMEGPKYDINEIVNFPIQAIAAITLCCIKNYICNKLLPSLNDDDPDIYLFLNHYDALAFDCRNNHVAAMVDNYFREAVEYVSTNGYWAMWQDRTSNKVSLEYEIKQTH